MADLFFYGTLQHVPLLEVVLGRPAAALEIAPAELPDHAVFWADGKSFPMIDREPGGQAQGLLVSGLSDGDIDRLAYYEGGFDYALTDMALSVKGGACTGQVFLPRPGAVPRGAAWSLEDWQARWGEMSVIAAEEIMAYYGRLSAAEIAERFYPIRVRAAQVVRARRRDIRRDEAHSVDRDVVVHARKRPYLNFFSIEELDVQFRRFDGSLSPVVNRAALRVGDASVVLPYDPVLDSVLLVQQFRPASFIAGDKVPWLWEAPAGLVDPGETPEQAAYREAQEEARVTLTRLEPVTQAYSTTGASTEYAHIFVGLADLSGAGAVAGLESEDEDIRSEVIPFADFLSGVERGAYVNLHLVTVAYWLALNRERLRAA